MMWRIGAATCALLVASGCTGGSADSEPPAPPAAMNWGTACPAFDDLLRKSFVGLFTAPADDYYAYAKKLDALTQGVRSSDAAPFDRVAEAAEDLGDLTVPSDPDPNTPEQLDARDELSDAIIAAEARCKALGHPMD